MLVDALALLYLVGKDNLMKLPEDNTFHSEMFLHPLLHLVNIGTIRSLNVASLGQLKTLNTNI